MADVVWRLEDRPLGPDDHVYSQQDFNEIIRAALPEEDRDMVYGSIRGGTQRSLIRRRRMSTVTSSTRT